MNTVLSTSASRLLSRVPVIEGAHQCAASHAGGARATTRDLVICHFCPPSADTLPPPLRHRCPQGIILCDEGGVAPCHVKPLLSFGWVVGGVDADTVSIRMQARSVHRHVVRPLLALHRHWVAKLYAVELCVGDGVPEKSGRGGVARSRPNGTGALRPRMARRTPGSAPPHCSGPPRPT